MQSVEQKFWPRVQKADGCWGFKGKGNKYGYGVVWLLAHRIAYELAKGPIPKGLSVLHKCDNRRCVNPAHLFLGTQSDNAKDMIKKGKYPLEARRGENNWKHKLTEDQVREIRDKFTPGSNQHQGNARLLAKEYGVTSDTITNIGYGRRWRHIPSSIKQKRSKLSPSQVFSIRARFMPGVNQWTYQGNALALAKEFGLDRSTIRRIAKQQSYKEV